MDVYFDRKEANVVQFLKRSIFFFTTRGKIKVKVNWKINQMNRNLNDWWNFSQWWWHVRISIFFVNKLYNLSSFGLGWSNLSILTWLLKFVLLVERDLFPRFISSHFTGESNLISFYLHRLKIMKNKFLILLLNVKHLIVWSNIEVVQSLCHHADTLNYMLYITATKDGRSASPFHASLLYGGSLFLQSAYILFVMLSG